MCYEQRERKGRYGAGDHHPLPLICCAVLKKDLIHQPPRSVASGMGCIQPKGFMTEVLSTHSSSGLCLALLMLSTSQSSRKWGEERRGVVLEALCKALQILGCKVQDLGQCSSTTLRPRVDRMLSLDSRTSLKGTGPGSGGTGSPFFPQAHIPKQAQFTYFSLTECMHFPGSLCWCIFRSSHLFSTTLFCCCALKKLETKRRAN